MKYFTQILLVIAILFSVAMGVLYFTTNRKLAEKEAEIEGLQFAHQTIGTELYASSESLKTLKANIESQRKALSRTKEELASALTETNAATQETARMKQNLRKVMTEKEALETEVQDLRSNLITTERDSIAVTGNSAKIAQLKERVTELEEANETLKSELRSAQRVATKSAADAQNALQFAPNRSTNVAIPASLGQSAQIRSIDQSRGILILDSGSALGLSPGATVKLIKDLKVVAKIQVVKVTATYTITNILPGPKTSRDLMPGTSVRILP